MGYIGKDVVHDGCGLPFSPKRVWDNIPYSVQKGIKKAEKNNVRIEKVIGNSEDIEILKGMWYDPNDPNMPRELRECDYMFIAFLGEVAIGATILLPVGNHLFLNNLAGSPRGKELHIQDYLLWHCVNYFENTEFKYIDVGVSFRPSLYNFFKKWRVESYPIIFNPPSIPLTINDYPFLPHLYHRDFKNTLEESCELISKLAKCSEWTFFPSEEYARKLVTSPDGNYTFRFPDIKANDLCYINLYQLFNVQFGTLVFGKKLTDQEMWNNYGCLDVFKREYTLKAMYDELLNAEEYYRKRINNYNYLVDLFSYEDIYAEKHINEQEIFISYFYFIHERNSRYSSVLNDFSIKHYYNKSNNIIGLPVHQNLTNSQLDYVYGIFRGVLNLCSEWEHTDIYDKYKI